MLFNCPLSPANPEGEKIKVVTFKWCEAEKPDSVFFHVSLLLKSQLAGDWEGCRDF